MSSISQSVLSLEYVSVLVTTQDAAPTSDTVQMAFVAPNTNPGSGDWKTASWATQPGIAATQGIAQCLVGPGGAATLPVGAYTIWVKVTDSPEIPVQPAGTLNIY